MKKVSINIMGKKGHCIICHKDDVELNDEHIIPEAIGGYKHIYNVCTECNSKLGENVDSKLLNHWFIIASRHEKHLKGYSGAIPNPLLGDGVLSTGEKVRMEVDSSGLLFPRLLPSSPEVAPDKMSFKIKVDAKDVKLIPQMQSKVLKKNKLDSSKYQLLSTRNVEKIEHPEVKMQFKIDMRSYRFGLLKIAYEIAVDQLEGYYDDPMAKLYSAILYEESREIVDRLDEACFVGDGITDVFKDVLSTMIDYSNTDRHLVVLANIKGKLHCMVKIFDKFCQVIRMSDKPYGQDNIVKIIINDFNKKVCEVFTPEDLIVKTRDNSFVQYKFTDEGDQFLKQAEVDGDEYGFAANKYGQNILYDPWGNAVCTEDQLEVMLHHIGLVNIKREQNKVITTHTYPYGYHLMLEPFHKLVQVKETARTESFNPY